MSGIPLWNVSKTDYADGSCEVVVASRAIMKYKKPKKLYFGCRELSEPECTPFGYAEREIVDEELFFGDLLSEPSEEELARRAAHSQYESKRRAKKIVEIIARCNRWKYFVTLTFDPAKVDSYNYEVCAEAIKKWLDCMKHRYPNAQYLLVFEKHKSGRYHVHALIYGCDLRLIDSGKKTSNHQIIYNMDLSEYNLGFTTVTYVRDSGAVAMYLSKYIGKALGDVPAGARRYWASRGLKRGKDCCIKYLFDKAEEFQLFIETLMGVADRVNSVFVEAINTTFTYYKIFGAGTLSASCPT